MVLLDLGLDTKCGLLVIKMIYQW